MAGKNLDYWYDEQIKRYLLQLVRVFSNFQVREYTKNGVSYNRVPCRYADASRMVSLLLRNNSENMVNNAPQITVGIQSIQPARDRAQDPFLQDTQQVAEREWDKTLGVYTSEQGNLYTTKRYMPVPYNMTIQVDIWTTNTDTKLQLLEQIFVIFNPSIQLQSNANPLDWSSVFEVELTDISWSSRSLPAGTEEQLDISTLTFMVPIWISPPAKVMRQQIIQKIINDIHNTNSVADLGYDEAYYDFFGSMAPDASVIVSPGDCWLRIARGSATLLDITSKPLIWSDIINQQGELTETSRLEINITGDKDDLSQLVIGNVVANPLDASQLIFNVDVDTLPSDTLPAIDRIIDPGSTRPGNGLPPAQLGQRYLLTENLLPAFVEWGGISAVPNDIIEFNGSDWTVVFDSTISHGSGIYVTNEYSSEQYTWSTGGWISSWQGTYKPEYWRLIL